MYFCEEIAWLTWDCLALWDKMELLSRSFSELAHFYKVLKTVHCFVIPLQLSHKNLLDSWERDFVNSPKMSQSRWRENYFIGCTFERELVSVGIKRVNFFCCKNDLLLMIQNIEKSLNVKYAAGGVYSSINDVRIYTTLL